MPLRRAAHSVYDCHYHLVWTPKRRRPVLSGVVGERLRVLFVEIGEAYDIDIEEMHIADDHVHLYCSFPPSLSISGAVMRLKSLSARALFAQFPDLRRRMWRGKLWAEGYFVRTVGDAITGDIVKRYIARHRDDASITEEDEEDFAQLGLFG